MVGFLNLIKWYQGSTLMAVSVLHSFLWLNNIPLCRHTTFCLSIHPLMHIWAVFTFWLLYIILLWAFTCKLWFDHLFSVLLGIYLGVKLLGHMVILCWTFWGSARLFSKVPEPLYIPISCPRGFQFLYIFASTCYCLFRIAILVDYSWLLNYKRMV